MKLIKKLLIFLLFFTTYSQKLISSPKEDILANFALIKNLSFEFKQQIGEKIERGNCQIEYPKLMYCLYENDNRKEIISNGRTLVIKNNRYNKTYFYRLKKTPLNYVLDKKYIIEEIKNLEPQVTDNGNIKFSVTREDDSFIFFFNSKTFDLVGWKTIDIYQNVVIFEINNVQKNIDIDKKLFKLILFLTIFYMFIFLVAELTAVSLLVNYISGTSLWITALIVIVSSLIYTLYGGLRASIFTDNIQFIVILLLLLISFNYLISFNSSEFSFEFIKQNKPILLSAGYLPNFTAGLTFFIAVAATNLFHQGNWQRVYAAKSNEVLNKSLIISFFIIIPIVFFMGFSGLVAASINSNVIPDLAFFSLLLKEQNSMISVIVIILAISLTISSIDTLINAISSLIIVDGSKVLKFKGDYLKLSKNIIILLSAIALIVASKGLSILYLFLLADLLCCAAVLTVFF